MSFEVFVPWLILAFVSGPASMYWSWRGRARRYEDTLRLARGLIYMNRADYALHHIKEALERR